MQRVVFWDSLQPGAKAGKFVGKTPPQADDSPDDGEHDDAERGHREPEELRVFEGAFVEYCHHDEGDDEQGEQSDQAVDDDCRDGFGLFVVRFVRDIPGLDDIAACGAEHESVEEHGNERNRKEAGEPDLETLNMKDPLPTNDPQDGGDHRGNGRSDEPERIDLLKLVPQCIGPTLHTMRARSTQLIASGSRLCASK